MRYRCRYSVAEEIGQTMSFGIASLIWLLKEVFVEFPRNRGSGMESSNTTMSRTAILILSSFLVPDNITGTLADMGMRLTLN